MVNLENETMREPNEINEVHLGQVWKELGNWYIKGKKLIGLKKRKSSVRALA